MEFCFPGYSLRPAIPEDRQYFLDCMAESLMASVDFLEYKYSDTWMPAAMSLVSIHLDSGHMENELHILEQNNTRVGMLWLGRTIEQFTCEDTGYILGIYVDYAHRGKGLAKAMISAAETWARERGCIHLSMNCGTTNYPAASLYASTGYSERSVVFRKDLYP